MNTPTTAPPDFDTRAETIARGTEPLTGIDVSYLIHAARYEGPGWRRERRTEIVNHICRELLGKE